MRSEFLLEDDVVFLNHGSFGACPREVHDEYQRLQRQLERQPVRFLQREYPNLIAQARAALAEFIGASDTEVVFVSNPTYAVNEIVRSLDLNPGDEVLISNHEYGACRNAWDYMAAARGFEVIEQDIPLPYSDEAFIERFWQRVTAQTKVIFLSHITSPTALTLPVAEICHRAGERGILTVIDGAHAPGQMELDLQHMQPDFYVATCHKWLCAPKGSAFMYARQAVQHKIEPLIVGWGWGSERRLFDSGSNFLDYHEWLGTHDPSAYLSVPAAIAFQRQHDWHSVRNRCHQLAIDVIEAATSRIPQLTRVHSNQYFQQMALLELHQRVEPFEFRQRLYERHLVEVPVTHLGERQFLRVSLQAYNTPADVDKFVDAVARELEG